MNKSALGFLAGVLFFFSGLAYLGNSIQSTRGAVRTQGIVVDVAKDWDFDDGKYLYAPVVEFRVQDGSTHRATSTVYSGGEPVIGRAIEVAYHPATPESAVVYNIWELFVFPFAFILPGVFFMGIFGIGPWLIAKKNELKTREA